MVTFSPANDANSHQSLISKDHTTTANGTGISVKGFTHLLAILSVGTVTGTTPTLDVKLESSSTVGGTYAAITGATFTQVTGTPSTATATQKVGVSLRGKAGFIRAVATIAGTSPVFPASVVFVLSGAEDTAVVAAADANVD
jgi:uncharacterized protein YcsI (UPF0317 family)